MNTDKTGGPAFPLSTIRYEDGLGMTLRDYFAAKAMQSMVAADHLVSTSNIELTARGAYQFADAMIAARNEGGAA